MKHESHSADPVIANGTTSGAPQSGMAREYHAFLTDVEDLISSATSLTGEDLTRAKAALAARIAAAKAAVGKAGAAVGKAGSLVTERAQKGAKATDDYVRTQPWQAVGITAVVGVLVGFLLGRRGS
jgi:ElaB/YqjD/DUF883 family membrane-anchored ribosome-binding protein